MKNKNRRPNLYIIAGPNGAGKTIFARKFLPQYVECLEFVNADFIAGGLSPCKGFGWDQVTNESIIEKTHSSENLP